MKLCFHQAFFREPWRGESLGTGLQRHTLLSVEL